MLQKIHIENFLDDEVGAVFVEGLGEKAVNCPEIDGFLGMAAEETEVFLGKRITYYEKSAYPALGIVQLSGSSEVASIIIVHVVRYAAVVYAFAAEIGNCRVRSVGAWHESQIFFVAMLYWVQTEDTNKRGVHPIGANFYGEVGEGCRSHLVARITFFNFLDYGAVGDIGTIICPMEVGSIVERS